MTPLTRMPNWIQPAKSIRQRKLADLGAELDPTGDVVDADAEVTTTAEEQAGESTSPVAEQETPQVNDEMLICTAECAQRSADRCC